MSRRYDKDIRDWESRNPGIHGSRSRSWSRERGREGRKNRVHDERNRDSSARTGVHYDYHDSRGSGDASGRPNNRSHVGNGYSSHAYRSKESSTSRRGRSPQNWRSISPVKRRENGKHAQADTPSNSGPPQPSDRASTCHPSNATPTPAAAPPVSVVSLWGSVWSEKVIPLSGARWRDYANQGNELFKGTLSKKGQKLCTVVVSAIYRQWNPQGDLEPNVASVLASVAACSSMDLIARIHPEMFFDEVALPLPLHSNPASKKIIPLAVGMLVPDSSGDETGLNWLTGYLLQKPARAGYLRPIGPGGSVQLDDIHCAVLPVTSRYHDGVVPGCTWPILVIWQRQEPIR